MQPKLTRPWQSWALWTFACAVAAACVGFRNSSLQHLLSDEPRVVFNYAGWVALISLVLPRVLEWAVLRRVFPGLGLAAWFGIAVLTSLAWFTWLAFLGGDAVAKRSAEAPARVLHLALLHARADGIVTWTEWLALPWATFLAACVLSALISCLLASLLVGRTRWRLVTALLLAAVVATIAASFAEVLSAPVVINRMRVADSWGQLLQSADLAAATSNGAFWGAVCGLTFLVLSSSRGFQRGADAWPAPAIDRVPLAAMSLATIAIAVVLPALWYVNGPTGWRAGFPAVRRSLTSAPVVDNSVGETVLRFSHKLANSRGRVRELSISPDGRSLVLVSTDHERRHIDLATGQELGVFGPKLDGLEPYQAVWSPDSRHFITRTHGRKRQGRSPYGYSIASQVRAYSASDRKLVAEWDGTEASCTHSHAIRRTASGADYPMRLARDGSALWLLCGDVEVADRKAGDPVAVKLALPGLQLVGKATYGELGSARAARGIVEHRGRIASWHLGYKSTDDFLVMDLEQGKVTLRVTGLAAPDLGAGMTFQDAHFDEETVTLRYCGFPFEHLNKADRAAIMAAINRCRALRFEIATGRLLETHEFDRNAASTGRLLPAIAAGERRLRVVVNAPSDSRTGTIVLSDSVTGAEVQRITTAAQRLLGISADGTLLATAEMDSDALRFYRVVPKPAAPR